MTLRSVPKPNAQSGADRAYQKLRRQIDRRTQRKAVQDADRKAALARLREEGFQRPATTRTKPVPEGKIDKPYRRWIAGQPCLVAMADDCETFGTFCCDPHHVRTRGAGGHDRNNLVPLCRDHHGLLDSPGWSQRRFAQHFGVDLAAEAFGYDARYHVETGR